jgi:transposase
MALKLDFTQPPPPVQTLAEAQALIGVLWEIARQVEVLQGRVAELEEQVSLSSRNSSQPPSQDGPDTPRPALKKQSGRPRGGQKGHPGHYRALVPSEQVDVIVPCQPPETVCGCGQVLPLAEEVRWRHQVIDLPPVKPYITEYQGFDVTCPRCGARHEAPLPPGVPSGQLGPRRLAEVGLLAGRYHLSLRLIQAWLQDCYGLVLSLGVLSQAQGRLAEALAEVSAQVQQAVREAQVVHSDETSRRYRNERRWLWVAATTLWVAFCTTVSRGQAEAKALLGECLARVIITDRYSAYHWLPLACRQICWAHLLRDFERMAGRLGPAGRVGRWLRAYGQVLFRWHPRYQKGELDATTYQRRMAWLRGRLRRQLEHGAQGWHAKTAGTCKKILQVEPALWTFVTHPEVPPTNNRAERALRPFVIWRKLSLHTQAKRGDLFIERILTVVETCRLQGRPVAEYLTAVVKAHLSGEPPPSLVSAP